MQKFSVTYSTVIMSALKMAALLAVVLIFFFICQNDDDGQRQKQLVCENARNPYHTCGTFCEYRKQHGSKVTHVSECPIELLSNQKEKEEDFSVFTF